MPVRRDPFASEVEPTTVIFRARALVETARAHTDGGRGREPAVLSRAMEDALVARILRELAPTQQRVALGPPPIPRAELAPPIRSRAKVARGPNPFLTPPRPGDPLPPWAVSPPRRARKARRRSSVPLLVFLTYAALAFALAYDPGARADALVVLSQLRATSLELLASWR